MLTIAKTKKYLPYLQSFNKKGLFSSPVTLGIMAKAILDFSHKDLKDIQESWEKTKQENDKILEYNKKARGIVIKQLEEICYDLGLPTYVHEHGKIVGEHVEFKVMLKQLDIYMPIEPESHIPIPLAIHSGNSDIKPWRICKNLIEFVMEMQPIIADLEQQRLNREAAEMESRQKEQVIMKEKKYITMQERMKERLEKRRINEEEKAKWLARTYPPGKSITINLCSDCNTWKMGEKNCSCGRTHVVCQIIGIPGHWRIKTYAPYVAIQPLVPV